MFALCSTCIACRHVVVALSAEAAANQADPATSPRDDDSGDQDVGRLLLDAGRSMIAAVRGERYDPRFECVPGDLKSTLPLNKSVLDAMPAVSLLYVSVRMSAGTTSSADHVRKVLAAGIVFPEAKPRVRWTRVVPTPSDMWIGAPTPVSDTASIFSDTVDSLLDPKRTPCSGSLEGQSVARILCPMRARSPGWEAKCIDAMQVEENASKGACARLAAPNGPEQREVGLQIHASFGVAGRERGIVHVQQATLRDKRLCLRNANYSHYFLDDGATDAGR